MHLRSDGTQIHAAVGFPRMGAGLILLLLGCWGIACLARSLHGLIRALDQTCGACDLGAFEPPLKPLGRQPDGRPADSPTGWPAAVGGTPIEVAKPAGARFAVTGGGAWLDSGHLLDAIDPPRFGGLPGGAPAAFAGQQASGPWRLAPVWTSAYPGMTLSWSIEPPVPPDGGGRAAAGTGWHEHYPSNDRTLREKGEPNSAPAGRAAWIDSLRSYARVAVQQELERHFPRIGDMGVQPGGGTAGAETAGGELAADTRDALTGLPTDAHTRFTIDPDAVTGVEVLGDGLSAHATLIHDSPPLAATTGLLGMNGVIAMDTFRAIASYTFGANVTPSVQYFHTAGSANAVRFVWPGARQTNAGLAAGVAFDPWPEPDSPVRFLNLRVAARYVAYTEFSGAPRGTAGNNALVLSLWGALRF